MAIADDPASSGRRSSYAPALRVVVYTAIYGSRDELREAPRFPGVRYVCFTDNEKLVSKTWDIRVAKGFSADPRRNTKIFKILAHHYFPEYEYSLWVDGTHVPAVDPRFLVHTFLEKSDIALFRHPVRNCIYEEMAECIRCCKDDPAVIREQEHAYRNDGYPEQRGLVTCTVILRRHSAAGVREAMEAWWREIERHSVRDQLSFNYIAYRMHLDYALLPGNVYLNHFFTYHPHVHPVSNQPRIGWIMNGSLKTASARIMGYNIHKCLSARGVPSAILYSPRERIISRLPLTKSEILRCCIPKSISSCSSRSTEGKTSII